MDGQRFTACDDIEAGDIVALDPETGQARRRPPITGEVREIITVYLATKLIRKGDELTVGIDVAPFEFKNTD
jgi:hypothetical protein